MGREKTADFTAGTKKGDRRMKTLKSHFLQLEREV